MDTKRSQLMLSSGRTITVECRMPDGYAPGDAAACIAHGAANTMDHPVVRLAAETLTNAGILTVRFNFPYAEEGGRSPDDRETLLDAYLRVVRSLNEDPAIAPSKLLLGGKSLGGIIAARVAQSEDACDGVFLLGYPLHPPGKPEMCRTDLLRDIDSPVLIVSGTNDEFCDRDLLEATLTELQKPNITMQWIEDANHSFEVDAARQQPAYDELARILSDWAASRIS